MPQKGPGNEERPRRVKTKLMGPFLQARTLSEVEGNAALKMKTVVKEIVSYCAVLWTRTWISVEKAGIASQCLVLVVWLLCLLNMNLL